MWREVVANLTQDNKYVKLKPPASIDYIALVEKKLNIMLPKDLKALLMEMNGDGNFLLSAEEIIETNISLRELEVFMPLDCLLFFAGNGCGDYFGYQIRKDGLNENNIFMWNHESDNRIWCAEGLEDAITKYYSDRI